MSTKISQCVDQKETQELKHEIIEEKMIELEQGVKCIERTTKTKIQSQSFTRAIEQEYAQMFQTLLLNQCDNSPEALWRIQQKKWKKKILQYDSYDNQLLDYQRIRDNLTLREDWLKKTLKDNHESFELEIIDNYVQEQGDLIMLNMIKEAWQPHWFTFDGTRIGLLGTEKALRVVGVLTSKTKEQFDVALPIIAARKIVAHQSTIEQEVLEKLIKQFKDQGIPMNLLSYEAQMAQKLSLHVKEMIQEDLKDVNNLIAARRFYWEVQRRVQANHLEKYIDQEALQTLKTSLQTHENKLKVQDKIEYLSSEIQMLDHLKQSPQVLKRKDDLKSEMTTLFENWGKQLYP